MRDRSPLVILRELVGRHTATEQLRLIAATHLYLDPVTATLH